jgi:acetyl esterase/lipase
MIRRLLVSVLALAGATLALAPAAQALVNPPVVGVPYGTSPEELVSIWTPPYQAGTTTVRATSASPAPAVVLVHGGGWRQQFSDVEQATVAQGLRSRGSAVFDVNYPQASFWVNAFPKEPEAVAAAVVWVHAHAAEFGADPENIILLGGSAGGHLVNLVGEERLPGVRAVISLSGPTNLVSLLTLAQHQELRESLAVGIAMALGCGRNTTGWQKVLFCGAPYVALAEQFSPASHVGNAPCPNWALFSAEEDLVPLSQQQEFLPALQAGGCNASLTVVSGKGHSFGFWPSVSSQVYSFIAAN